MKARRRAVVLAVLALSLPAAAESQSWSWSWTKHAAASTAITVAGHLVLKEPWIGAGIAVGLNVGHEIGQARVRRRWDGDNTRDLIGGTASALITSALLHRFATRPREQRLLGLQPLTPPEQVRTWYETLARCLEVPSRFERVRWFTSETGSLSHNNVVVLYGDSILSAAAVRRSLLPHFGQRVTDGLQCSAVGRNRPMP